MFLPTLILVLLIHRSPHRYLSLIDSLITDHYPIIAQIIDYNLNTINNNINTDTIIFNPINYNKLNNLIKLTNWLDIITYKNNANVNINIFTTSIKMY